MDDLKSLIIVAQAGDLSAVSEIVRRFQDMAVGYAYSILGDFHLAEDAAQEAFVDAYLKLRTLREPEAFPGWLRTIVFKHCDRIRRGNSIKIVPLEAVGEMRSAEPDPVEAAERQEMKDNVLDAIGALPKHEQVVTTLFYINGYTQNDIADFLEVPATTINSRLRYARKRLRERMIAMVKDTLSGHAPSRDNELTKKVLERVQPVPGDSTFVGTLYAVLRAAGEDWSINRLLGTFGHPFNFGMKKWSNEVWQQATIDWYLIWDMFHNIGYEFHEFNANLTETSKEEAQALRDQAWVKVKESIDRGIPAIAWQPMTVEQRNSGFGAHEWGLLVGYDEKEKTYTVRHQYGRGEYTVPYDQFGHTDDANWYCVFVLGSPKPFDRMAVETQSLKHAVAFARGRRYDRAMECSGADAVGFAAYELWREAFQSGKVSLRFALLHAQYLQGMRASAAKYLREIADHFPEASTHALSDAATLYEEEAETATKLVDVCRSAVENNGFTTPMLQEAMTALNDALDVEREAIRNIEEALASLNS